MPEMQGRDRMGLGQQLTGAVIQIIQSHKQQFSACCHF